MSPSFIALVVSVGIGVSSEEVRTVAVGFPEEQAAAVTEVLSLPLAESTPGVEWRFDPVPPDALAEVLGAPGGERAVAVLGYALPLLRELAVLDRFDAAPPCALASPEAGAPGDVHALWFDPVVLVWSDGGTGIDVRPQWVPESIDALCEGGVDERLLLARATSWNATGALVTALEAAGGRDEAEARLIRLDGNRAGPYVDREDAVLRRLAALEPSPVAVTSRATLLRFRGEEPEAGARLHAVSPRDRVVALLHGAAAVDAAAAAPLFAALGDPVVLAAVGRAASLLPLSERVGDDSLPGDAEAFRTVLAAELPSLAREQSLARAAVERYVHEIVGRHEGREELYSEVFDALGVAAMAVFVLWVLRRRDGAARGPEAPA